MAPPIRVLHVLSHLSRGGAGRALVAMAAEARRDGASVHRIMSLGPAVARELARLADVPVIEEPAGEVIARELDETDILHVHFWNTPALLLFLRDCTAPARILLWSHVTGDTPPQLLRQELADWADATVASSSYPGRFPAILASPDFSRLQALVPLPHGTFNVGYLGTVDPVKMHPDYVRMSADINVPHVRFVVCGSGGGFAALAAQAASHGVAERFEFRGYVEDISSVLATLDVFGYPVVHCSAELVLQEAMFAGIPPVIFANGGAQSLVQHGETGLIVTSADGYARAVEWLYHHPEERRRLGANAAAYARRTFGADRTASAMNALYARMMAVPKRPRRWPFGRRTSGKDHGAWMFLDLLGDAARPFETSLTSDVTDDLFHAESAIADIGPIMVDAGAGGLLDYRRHFPDDPYLRLWSGLVLRRQGRPALAISEFETARRLGIDHWRVSWYVAETARVSGARPLAIEALQRVVDAAPEFVPGRLAFASLGGSS